MLKIDGANCFFTVHQNLIPSARVPSQQAQAASHQPQLRPEPAHRRYCFIQRESQPARRPATATTYTYP